MRHRVIGAAALLSSWGLLCLPAPVSAQTAPSLGTAQSFAVLGGSTVTNTGSSVVTGDLGVSPGTAITGFPPGVVAGGGAEHAGDAVAQQARSDMNAAYDALAGQACTSDMTGQNLGGRTLAAGVYCFSSSAQLTGTLALDAMGNANAVFIFQVGSTVTTASNAAVSLRGGAQSCNVFWQVGTSATIGSGTSFAGNVLAQASITLNTGADVSGRVLARDGAVTLDTNEVAATVCSIPPVCPEIILLPATLPAGRVGAAYAQTITGSGGVGPYRFTLGSGSLPAGLGLTTAGVLSGTPSAVGSSTFSVRGTDANGCFAEASYTIAVAAAPPPPPTCPPIALLPAVLPQGRVGVAYARTITGDGGTAPYTFGVTSGALPAGLTLTPAGVLSGTPTLAATSSFTVRATDALGCFAELPYVLVIAIAIPPPPTCPPIALLPAVLPQGRVGIAYSQRITGSGGTAPYRFGVTAGSLPAGLTLTGAGVLSGTPTLAALAVFTVRGTDANGCFAERSYLIAVAAAPPLPPICPPISLLPAELPDGSVGVAYEQTIKGGGGKAPYLFGVVGGSLPPGLVLTAGGVLSGKPAQAGASLFVVRGTDANGCIAEIPYVMTVDMPVPTMSPWGLLLLAGALTGFGYLRLRRRQAVVKQ